MGDGKSTLAQTPPFRLEPLLEVPRGGKQVHDLALTHHHHRVREIDRERLPKPAGNPPRRQPGPPTRRSATRRCSRGCSTSSDSTPHTLPVTPSGVGPRLSSPSLLAPVRWSLLPLPACGEGATPGGVCCS